MVYRYFLALLSGALTSLTCLGILPAWVAYVSVVPFLKSIDPSRNPTPPPPYFRLFFIYGLMLMGGVYGWIFSLSAWLPTWGLWGVFIIVSLFQSLFYGGIGLGIKALHLKYRWVGLICLYVGMEWLRSLGPIGSSLGQLGYTQTAYLPMMQLASMLGVVGVTALIVCVNIAIYHLLLSAVYARRLSRLVFLCIGFVAIVFCWGTFRLGHPSLLGTPLHVGIAQGNHPQELKLAHENRHRIWRDYFHLLSRLDHAQLIVLPETITSSLTLRDPYVMSKLRKLAISAEQHILFGTPILEKDHYFNAIAMVSDSGVAPSFYKKHHLMPFGEYLPYRPFFDQFGLSALLGDTDYTAGPSISPWDIHGLRTGPLICLESIYAHVARSQALQGATLLISIANNGWFVGSSISTLHLQMAQARAIETGLPMVHVSNQGPSGIFSPQGSPLTITRPFTEATGSATVLVGNAQPTFFVRYGYWFALGLLGVYPILLGLSRKTLTA